MTKKPAAKKRSAVAKKQRDSLAPLIAEVRGLIQSARNAAASTVNTLQVLTNFEIGRRIVEYEQKGENRAGYGRELIKSLSAKLTDEFGKGFSKANLEYMRRFYIGWQDRVAQIAQQPTGQFMIPASHQPSVKSAPGEIAQTPSGQSGNRPFAQELVNTLQKSQTVSGKSSKRAIGQQATDQLPSIRIDQTVSEKLTPVVFRQTPSAKSDRVFGLNWSHYVLLMTIQDEGERRFYEIEALSEGWSLRDLKRQVASCLYERLALSRKKKDVRKLAAEGQIVARPEDVLKDPYVLEFLGLDEKASYSENDFEQAIIGRIEHFLLELGKGFLFEARQKRFTFDDDHFYVDLVFYNRLLRCYVLVDLKLDKITHQDLGQMQMYVNYFDREVKLPEENATIGILLCKRKKDAIVELTLPKDANVHAREYKLYLPSKEALKKKLLE